MPLKSKLQYRWMKVAEERGELPKGTADRWLKETPGGLKSLPEKKKKKSKGGKS